MPELPEVEVLRRSLAPHLLGRRIVAIEVRDRRLREPVDPVGLATAALNRRMLALRRRSKYLLIDLEGGHTLLLHLGMSGRLTVAPAAAPSGSHEHVALRLDDGSSLRFRDPRRFGLFAARPTARVLSERRFTRLGVEPLSGELDGDLMRRAAIGRRGAVKSFLMSGEAVVGVGNIYACEALYQARIHPERSVARISLRRWKELAAAVRGVLDRAISEGGTTLSDFVDGEGREGLFQVSLAVYGRAGEPCLACGAPIRRRVTAGRSTFYCPRCQR